MIKNCVDQRCEGCGDHSRWSVTLCTDCLVKKLDKTPRRFVYLIGRYKWHGEDVLIGEWASKESLEETKRAIERRAREYYPHAVISHWEIGPEEEAAP